MEGSSAPQVPAAQAPGPTWKVKGRGTCLTLVLKRRRQDHLWSLTAAIITNWWVPDAMKDTHLKVKGENDWEDQMSTPSLYIHMYTLTWRRRQGKMKNEWNMSKCWGMHVQGRGKLSGLAPSFPHGELRIKFRSSNLSASAFPHRAILPVLFLLNFKNIPLYLKLASYSP